MDSNRYFLLSQELYQQIRALLDAVFQHPNGKAETCLHPAPVLHEGRAVVGILLSMMEWPEVAASVTSLIASGQIEEVTASEYAGILASHSTVAIENGQKS